MQTPVPEEQASDEPHPALRSQQVALLPPHEVWAPEGPPGPEPAPSTLLLHWPLVDAEYLRRLPNSLVC